MDCERYRCFIFGASALNPIARFDRISTVLTVQKTVDTCTWLDFKFVSEAIPMVA